MNLKKLLALGLSLTMATALLAGCGSTNDTSADAGSAGESGDTSAEQVVIYSNADEEAITAMENALDSNGYEGQYVCSRPSAPPSWAAACWQRAPT